MSSDEIHMQIKIKFEAKEFMDGFLDGYVKTENGFKKIRTVSHVNFPTGEIIVQGLTLDGMAELKEFVEKEGIHQPTEFDYTVKWENGKPVHYPKPPRKLFVVVE